MHKEQLLDQPERRTELVLFSKTSIFLISIFATPLLGAFLYSTNLFYTDQKGKIFGTFLGLTFCYVLVSLPFFGMLTEGPLHPQLYIGHFAIGFLMISVLWEKHFGHLQYKTTFPWFRVLSLGILYHGAPIYFQWIAETSGYSIPLALILPGVYTLFEFITIVIAFRLIFHLILFIKALVERSKIK